MTIKNKDEMNLRGTKINLNGYQGNAYYLLAMARRISKQLGKDSDGIMDRMQSGDYENLVQVFEDEFGEYVTLYR